MTRLTRLTSILLQLQSRRVVTAQELADKFNITARTVYRDIRALEEAGVPIIGEAGKGYSLVDNYRVPPVMFTQEEINALLTAQQFFQKNADKSAYNDLSNVVTKVKAIIRHAGKEKAEKLEERVHVFSNEQSNETNLLPAIQLAITNNRVLNIKYHSVHSNSTTGRVVEPLGVYMTRGNWVMVAFCRMRKDLRELRIDRILKLITTNETSPEWRFSFEDYFKSLLEK